MRFCERDQIHLPSGGDHERALLQHLADAAVGNTVGGGNPGLPTAREHNKDDGEHQPPDSMQQATGGERVREWPVHGERHGITPSTPLGHSPVYDEAVGGGNPGLLAEGAHGDDIRAVVSAAMTNSSHEYQTRGGPVVLLIHVNDVIKAACWAFVCNAVRVLAMVAQAAHARYP